MPEEGQIPVRRHTRRARRRVVRKRSFFSFGDVILPFIGVLAIGLLVVAAKLFFFGGFNSASDIDVARTTTQTSVNSDNSNNSNNSDNRVNVNNEASADVSNISNVAVSNDKNRDIIGDILQELKAEINSSGSEATSTASQPKPAVSATAQPAAQVTPATPPAPAAPKTDATTKTPAKAPVATASGASGTKASSQSGSGSKPATQPAKSGTPAKANTPAKPSTPAKSNTSAPAKSNTSTAPQWRVQVGAYGSKQTAQGIANDLTKSGYKVTTYYTPGSKFYKVWVMGGTTKKDATETMNRLKAGGFPGSYLVPPAQN